MGVFGRRQTDEVFTTLQQVQRRLSHNTESGSTLKSRPTLPAYAGANVRAAVDHGAGNPNRASADRLAAPPTTAATTPADPPPADAAPEDEDYVRPPALTFRPTATSIPEPIPDTLPVGPRQRGVRIGVEVLGTLVAVWLATVAGAFLLGRHLATAPSPTDGVEEPEAPPYRRAQGGGEQGTPHQGERSPVGDELLGDDILVLKSLEVVTEAAEREFRDNADYFNREVGKPEFSRLGWKPWFGVRYPKSGGLQLVFGLVDGQFGINRKSRVAKMAETDFRKNESYNVYWLSLK